MDLHTAKKTRTDNTLKTLRRKESSPIPPSHSAEVLSPHMALYAIPVSSSQPAVGQKHSKGFHPLCFTLEDFLFQQSCTTLVLQKDPYFVYVLEAKLDAFFP